jgi:hypothetical protein
MADRVASTQAQRETSPRFSGVQGIRRMISSRWGLISSCRPE